MTFDNVYVIDFETYYDNEYQLKKMTTSEYVRDPRFEVIGVGVREVCAECDGAGTRFSGDGGCYYCEGSGVSREWYEAEAFRSWAALQDWSKVATLAHHAHFDNLILTHHFGMIKPAFIFDTLSMARALHGTDVGGSLDALSQHYGSGTKGKEVLDAKGKHRQPRPETLPCDECAFPIEARYAQCPKCAAFSPEWQVFTLEEWKRYGAYCLNDVDLTWDIFQKLGGLDGRFPQDELELIDQTVRMFTEPQFVLDKPRLEKFLAYEQERKRALLTRLFLTTVNPPECGKCENGVVDMKIGFGPCGECEELQEAYVRSQLQSSDKLAEVFRALGVEPPTKPSPKTGEPIYAFAKSDPGMQDLLEHPREEIRFLAEARVAVKSTINETRTGRLLSLADKGPLPIYLKYYGAHTGRDSGGDKINPQNFQRGGEIRKSINAPDGYDVVVADSAQIEARVNAWVAGHHELVLAFAANRDVYSEFATKAYGRHVDRKKNKEDFIPGFVGKTCTLGLGFQMSWAKFAGTMLAGALGGPPVVFDRALADQLGIRLGDFTANAKNVQKVREMKSRLPFEDLLVHCAVANEFVRRYRSENAPIVQLWQNLQDTLPVLAAMGEGERVALDWNPTFSAERHALAFPSGLPLRYPGLKQDYDGWEYFGGKRKPRVHLYGGKMTENVVQKFARNVVFAQALEIQRTTGYRPALRTHDELIYCAPKSESEQLLAAVLKIMRTPPAWAPGLPLNAEGDFGPVYGDCK